MSRHRLLDVDPKPLPPRGRKRTKLSPLRGPTALVQQKAEAPSHQSRQPVKFDIQKPPCTNGLIPDPYEGARFSIPAGYSWIRLARLHRDQPSTSSCIPRIAPSHNGTVPVSTALLCQVKNILQKQTLPHELQGVRVSKTFGESTWRSECLSKQIQHVPAHFASGHVWRTEHVSGSRLRSCMGLPRFGVDQLEGCLPRLPVPLRNRTKASRNYFCRPRLWPRTAGDC